MNPGKYVAFFLDGQRYGLPIESVEQILVHSPVTTIPKTSKEFLGIFSLRGETLPVIDTRVVLGLPETDHGYFLVVSVLGVRAAFIAERLDRILDLGQSQIELNKTLTSGGGRAYTGRVEEGLIVLLDPLSLMPVMAAV